MTDSTYNNFGLASLKEGERERERETKVKDEQWARAQRYIQKDIKRREEGSYREPDVLGRSLKVTLGFNFLFSHPFSVAGAPFSFGDLVGDGRNFGLNQ